MNPESEQQIPNLPLAHEGWLSMSEAALHTPYSAEYLSLLARKGKLTAKKVDNTWYTTNSILDEYMKRQMFREQVLNGSASLQSELSRERSAKVPKVRDAESMPARLPPIKVIRSYQDDHSEHINRQNSHPLLAMEPSLQKVIDKPSVAGIITKKNVLAFVIVSVILFTLFPVPFVFSFFEKGIDAVKDFVGDARTVMGFRPGTHQNELLLLDKEGNISIKGHIETDGQLRSLARDGEAPIVIDSKTLVKNLNAEYINDLSGKDFTLAFVTKNGAATTEDVELLGDVEVGKTLTIRGANKLAKALVADGDIAVLGNAEFGKILSVLGPSYFEGVVKMMSNLEVGRNLSVRGSIESGGSVIAKSASFANAGISGKISASLGQFNSVVADNVSVEALTAASTTVTNGVVTNLTSTNSSLSRIIFDTATGTSATSTNFFSTTLFSTTHNNSGLGTFGNILVTSSSTMQNFTFVNATGSAATTTNLYTSGQTILAGTSGNVGIGTTSPTAKFAVSGVDSTNSYGIYSQNGNFGGWAGVFQNTDSGGNKLVNLASGSYAALFNGGNVGIGTTGPGYALEVKGTGTGTLLGSAAFRDSSTNGNGLVVRNGTGVSNILSSYFGTAVASDLSFTPTTAAGVQTEAMRIASTGNVGIGTTGPNGKLTVWTPSATGVQNGIRVNNPFGFADAGTGASLIFSQDRSAAENYQMAGISGGQSYTASSDGGYLSLSTRTSDALGLQEKVRILASGNVGIGETSPGSKLSIKGGMSVGNDVLYSQIAAPTDGMIIKGNVGIGTTTPQRGLHLYGSNSVGSPEFEVTNTSMASGAKNFNIWGDSSTGTWQIRTLNDTSSAQQTLFMALQPSTGNVGIGDTSPDALFDVKGTVCLDLNADEVCTDNTAAISDARLKTNVLDLADGLGLVRQLRPVRFTWNGQYNTGTANSLGFLAQEVELIFPELVITDTAGYKNLDYGKLTAVLAKAIQELNTKVENIEFNLASASTSLEISTSTKQSIVASVLESIGATVIDGAMHIVKLAVESISTYALTVGKTDRPTGITFYDSATGEPYCFKITSSIPNATTGDCSTPLAEPVPEPVASSEPPATTTADTI